MECEYHKQKNGYVVVLKYDEDNLIFYHIKEYLESATSNIPDHKDEIILALIEKLEKCSARWVESLYNKGEKCTAKYVENTVTPTINIAGNAELCYFPKMMHTFLSIRYTQIHHAPSIKVRM